MFRIPSPVVLSALGTLGQMPPGQVRYSGSRIITSLAECQNTTYKFGGKVHRGGLYDQNRLCCVQVGKDRWTCAQTTFGATGAPPPMAPAPPMSWPPGGPIAAKISWGKMAAGGAALAVLAWALLRRRASVASPAPTT